MAPTFVLGINHGTHDGAAALLCDGELVVLIEQDRMSRRGKAIGEAPRAAVAACLDFAGITLADIAAVGLGADLDRMWDADGVPQVRRTQIPRIDAVERLLPTEERIPPIQAVAHHRAHGLSACVPSGWAECAVLVIDGRGEHCSTSIMHWVDGELIVLREYPLEASLGLYFQQAARYSGLRIREDDDARLMELAAYGRTAAKPPVIRGPGGEWFPSLDIAHIPVNKRWPVRKKQFLDLFAKEYFPYRAGTGEDTLAYAAFAASIQQSLEDAVLGLAEEAQHLTESSHLALAGGVALNSAANRRVADAGIFQGIFVQPAAHNAGTSWGAALSVERDLNLPGSPQPPLAHAYLGVGHDEDHMAEALEGAGVKADHLSPDDLVAKTAELLAAGEVVAWFQGRAEIGPNALGGRSILGDPRSRDTLPRINKATEREPWRPVGASVLDRHFNTWFEGTPNAFMAIEARVRESVRPKIPAVTHVDGSARPHSVNDAANFAFRRLIERFYSYTGVPMITNTPFRIGLEPVVGTPQGAIACFKRMPDIGALVIIGTPV